MATLELKYNLDTEASKAQCAVYGERLASILYGFVCVDLRSKLKYENEFKDADTALEWARDQLIDELQSFGIDLDTLIE